MWIKCKNKHMQSLLDREISEDRICMSETGTVNVSKSVGEALLEKYPSLFEPSVDSAEEDDPVEDGEEDEE